MILRSALKCRVIGMVLLMLAHITSSQAAETAGAAAGGSPFPAVDAYGWHSFEPVPFGGIFSGTVRAKEKRTRHFQIAALDGWAAALVITRRTGTRQVVMQHAAVGEDSTRKALSVMRAELKDDHYGPIVNQNLIVALPQAADRTALLTPWRELTTTPIVKPYVNIASKFVTDRQPMFQIQFNGCGAEWAGWETANGREVCYARCNL